MRAACRQRRRRPTTFVSAGLLKPLLREFTSLRGVDPSFHEVDGEAERKPAGEHGTHVVLGDEADALEEHEQRNDPEPGLGDELRGALPVEFSGEEVEDHSEKKKGRELIQIAREGVGGAHDVPDNSRDWMVSSRERA